MNPKIIAVLITIICSIFGAVGQLFFKLGSQQLTFNIIEQLTNYKLMLGLIFYGVATIGYIFALKQTDLSFLYPIIALSYVWTTILSVLILKEPYSHVKTVGLIGLITSIFLITK